MTDPAGRPTLVPTGIPGLDVVLRGGVPRGTLLLVEGRPGSGKTTLALQFLLRGRRDGERCLLVSNAETPEQLRAIATSHGWNLDGIRIAGWQESQDPDDGEEYTLFPEAEVEVGTSLQQLFALVDEIKPTLLAIDSVSALRVLAPTPAFYRRQLRRIRDFLAERFCTTLILDDASPDQKDIRSRTLADGIVELRQVDLEYGSDRRRLRVRKLRGATYVSGAHDFRIVTGGIEVYPRLVAQQHTRAADFTLAESGVAELDALAGGGLPRGTSTLILGPAGAGKSTLAALYAMSAAGRGEKASILLFDESPDTYITRSAGLGLDIGREMGAGRVRLNYLDPTEFTAGQIAYLLQGQVEEEGIGLVVIDTMNGYLQSGMNEPSIFLHLRELISYLSRRRVVTLLTLTQHGVLSAEGTTPIDLSYVADNVFLLRYFERGGTIGQALSMVKKRTGPHERSIRELRLNSGKIGLSEPLDGISGVIGPMPLYGGGTSRGGLAGA